MPRGRSAGAGTRGRFTPGRTGSGGTAGSSGTSDGDDITLSGVIGRVGRIASAITGLGATREGVCMCREPLTDEFAGVLASGSSDDEEDWCWRCRRVVVPLD